jgi:PAS domain S-box-containing protein
MPEAPPAAPGSEPLRIDATLRAAFELTPTVLAITTAGEGRFLEVNDAFARLHGYSRAEVIGRTVSELNLWVDPHQRRDALVAITSGSPVRDLEVRLRTKDGGERTCVLNADLIAVDGRSCILTALTDITDRVRAEAALRESEQRFLLAFHANPLPMSITRLSDGRHLEVNEAAVRHSGFVREELLGRTKRELQFWVAPTQQDMLIEQLRAHGHVRDYEVTFQRRDGEQRRLLVNSQVIPFGGEPAVLSVSVDITERIALEAENRARREEAEQLAASLREADRAKNDFLAMLGHELRNPLGSITTATAVLEATPLDDRQRGVLAIIRRQAGQLARLLDDLLDVSRLSAGAIVLTREPVDLCALARRYLDTLAQSGRAARHDVQFRGEPVHAMGDASRIEQVIANLMDNALKYTPPGGSIAVTTEAGGDEAVLRVRDSGQGIEPDLLPRVFDLFVQAPQALHRAQGGLGLGLAVVMRLVDLHGGTVTVESAGRNRGSEFTVRLPAAEAPAHIRGGPSTTTGAARRRVLIVEDVADARTMLEQCIALPGHIVETAEDGPSGLAKLRTFRPDVALIDIGLPGIDGYTLARLAREHPDTRHVRLIAVTGYGQMEDQERARAAGFDRHLTKPVDPARLLALVASL